MPQSKAVGSKDETSLPIVARSDAIMEGDRNAGSEYVALNPAFNVFLLTHDVNSRVPVTVEPNLFLPASSASNPHPPRAVVLDIAFVQPRIAPLETSY